MKGSTVSRTASERRWNNLEKIFRFFPECHGLNLALTVLHVIYSLAISAIEEPFLKVVAGLSQVVVYGSKVVA